MARRWCPFILLLLACQPSSQDAASAQLAPQASRVGSAGSARSVSSVRAEGAKVDRPGLYLGRAIAPTMSHEGADWLTRPEREAEEQASRMLAALGVKPGDVACDVGAGNGYHTLELARMVAPGGKALAVDIQPEMLALLSERAKAAKLRNVETILGQGVDPRLPRRGCDLVLLADVYHELDDPAGTLRHLAEALSPRGTLALLEFRAEDEAVPIKPEHKMSRAQMKRELEANGFVEVRSFDELPWQHLVFYARRSR